MIPKHSQSQKTVKFEPSVKKPRPAVTDDIDELESSNDDDHPFRGLDTLDVKTQKKVLMIPLSQIGQPQSE